MHPIRKRNRLHGYDYSSNAMYFVTSCVKDRICYFGEIKNYKMLLNEHGKIAQHQFEWLPQQYPYVIVHSCVVMPNHVHAIIEIYNARDVRTGRDVGTGRDLSLPPPPSSIEKIKSLSELMGAYKTTVSKQIHLAGLPGFAWQRSFHDHIIRNKTSYLHISNYIENNPFNWNNDKFYNR